MIDQPDLQKDFGSAGSPLKIAFMWVRAARGLILITAKGNDSGRSLGKRNGKSASRKASIPDTYPVQDLSLLVDLKYEDLQKLQAVGAMAQAEQAKLILRNDLGQVWEYLKGVKGGRVDIVLDNGQSLLQRE